MGKKRIIEQLKKYKAKQSIKIEKIIFFGSRAKGSTHKDSDIDLIVISKDFEGEKFVKRPYELYRMWDLGYPADILCYTPEEFKEMKKGINIVSYAIKEGIVI